MTTPQQVLDFWFGELEPEQWWRHDAAVDATIAERFGALHAQAAACELWSWRESAEGRLAEILTIDQFSRNLYRDSRLAFAWDPLALALAQEAVRLGTDRELAIERRGFLYMPYMHSESLVIHDQALPLFAQQGLELNLEFEHQHRAILERFGRYPHRNAVLGRSSTPEELAFLEKPGSSF